MKLNQFEMLVRRFIIVDFLINLLRFIPKHKIVEYLQFIGIDTHCMYVDWTRHVSLLSIDGGILFPLLGIIFFRKNVLFWIYFLVKFFSLPSNISDVLFVNRYDYIFFAISTTLKALFILELMKIRQIIIRLIESVKKVFTIN